MYQNQFGMNQFQYPINRGFIPKCEVIHVNGKNGAEAFQMAENSSVLLLDDTAPIVWLAQTDGAGYKTVKPFTINPYEPEPPVDVKSLEDRISKLEEMISDKSNSTSSRKKSTETV